MQRHDELPVASADEVREYLFDMLEQLARLAKNFGEHNIAAVLRAVVEDRTAVPRSDRRN